MDEQELREAVAELVDDWYTGEVASRVSVAPDARDDLKERIAGFVRGEQAEVERLRRECDDLEAIVGNYRTALLWIVAHDQTMRPNGGDPEWFAEEAPYRARKALAE
jgi:hypothetical protein